MSRRDGERQPQVSVCPSCGTAKPLIVADPLCFKHGVRHPNGERHK